MEMMLDEIFSHLSFIYIFICNIATYLIITAIPKDLSTWVKRLISTTVAVGAGAAFFFLKNMDGETLICSFFAQYLMYDYAIKGFIRRLSGTDNVKTSDKQENDIIIS